MSGVRSHSRLAFAAKTWRSRAIAAETALNTAKEENGRYRQALAKIVVGVVSGEPGQLVGRPLNPSEASDIARAALSTDRGGE